MESSLRRRVESLRLPVVEVEFAVQVLNDPKVRATLVGGRRQVVDAALQAFENAKQNQVDGRMEVDERHVRVVLLALGITQAWMRDLLFFQFEDDEQA